MLIFWNLAGVPLSYCHCSLYLANHAPSVYEWNRWALIFLYILYLFVYWVWDTANSQKNRFRQAEKGTLGYRTAFPQLPWREISNPKTIETEAGDSILVDGWCMSKNREPRVNSVYPLADRFWNRWICEEAALYLRCLLRLDLGPRDGVREPVSMVLPCVFHLYDNPSRPA